ncbi:recombinase family protein, partial [Altererythrobacter litoralis]|nr:recombinase family protein [Erythrobacteraceae bacterium 1XM1-14]
PTATHGAGGNYALTNNTDHSVGAGQAGIYFRRGSLFYLLKNPIYRGMIVHKGKVYDGEHEAIIDEALWDAVQARLKEKAPPRKRANNDRQEALLRGLLTDPQGRPMVPTYTKKGSRRYSYYETRKDLAKPGDAPSTRFGQGQLERHVIVHVTQLLEDEHALRRLAGLSKAGQLAAMFEKAGALARGLAFGSSHPKVISSLLHSIAVKGERIDILLNPGALGITIDTPISWSIPLPDRKPFREAKLRIDGSSSGSTPDAKLIALLGEARAARELILANPELSINQLAGREGRCRKQLTKLFRLSWLSPRIVEVMLAGHQPSAVTRQQILSIDLPTDWSDQEALLRIAR